MDLGVFEVRKHYNTCVVLSCNVVNKEGMQNKAILWHHRLGHPCVASLGRVLRNLNVPVSADHLLFCEACKLGKMHQKHFASIIHNIVSSFDLLHMDVWGPSSITSLDGYRYYLSIVDDFTRFTWIFPMQSYSDCYSIHDNGGKTVPKED